MEEGRHVRLEFQNSSTSPQVKHGTYTSRFCHMVYGAGAADGGDYGAHRGSSWGGSGLTAGATAPGEA
jgi:hypothetical protein